MLVSQGPSADSRSETWAPTALLAGLLVVVLGPHLVLGEASFVTIHDSLDSEVVWRHMLRAAGAGLDPDARIDQVMNGLSRGSFPSGLSLFYALFVPFEPFWAYVAHKGIVHAVAFLGMWGLLRRHVLPAPELRGVVLGVALCFGLTPHYSVFSLSIAGQPLLLMALLDLWKGPGRGWDWAIVAAFPFCSSFTHVGTFIVALLGAAVVAERVRTGRVPGRLLASAGLLLALYLVVEHALIATMFLSDVASHREIRGIRTLELGAALERGLRNFLHGQYHAVSRHELVLVFVVAASFPLPDSGRRRWLVLGLGAALAISLFYGIFGSWAGVAPLKQQLLVFRHYQFTRIHWLHPLLWSLLFGLALARLATLRIGSRRLGTALVALAIALQAGQLLRHSPEWRANLDILRHGSESEHVSFEEFVSAELFREIARFIARPQAEYRVASVGLPPAVAQWNGFYTLDSYQYSYPLDYHRAFRRVFAGELAKDEDLRLYYDTWGCRAKIFSAELGGRSQRGTGQTTIEDLQLDVGALRALGGEYLLSAYRIGNAAELGLTRLERFEAPASPWRVHLYGVGHDPSDYSAYPSARRF
jgi:hypothetical protein